MRQEGSPELESVLSRILAAVPSDTRLRRELAIAYAIHAQNSEINLSDPQEAILLYGKAISVDGNNPEWWLARANTQVALAAHIALYEKNFFVSSFAVKSIERLHKMRQRDGADSLSSDSLYKRAIEDYTMALRCDYSNVEALEGRAAVLSKMGRTDQCKRDCEEALDILDRALKANRRDFKSLIKRASVLELLDRNREALHVLRGALGMEPSGYDRELLVTSINRLECKLKA